MLKNYNISLLVRPIKHIIRDRPSVMVVFGKMEINDQVSDIKNEVFQLMSQKSRIENEIQQFFQILSAVSYKLWDC